jgi:hypothetical protein
MYLKTSVKGDGQCFYFDEISTLSNQKKGAMNLTNVFGEKFATKLSYLNH